MTLNDTSLSVYLYTPINPLLFIFLIGLKKGSLTNNTLCILLYAPFFYHYLLLTNFASTTNFSYFCIICFFFQKSLNVTANLARMVEGARRMETDIRVSVPQSGLVSIVKHVSAAIQLVLLTLSTTRQASADDRSKCNTFCKKYQNCGIFMTIFGITMKNALKCVPTCLVLVW